MAELGGVDGLGVIDQDLPPAGVDVAEAVQPGLDPGKRRRQCPTAQRRSGAVAIQHPNTDRLESALIRIISIIIHPAHEQ